jgi:hypothetical protein
MNPSERKMFKMMQVPVPPNPIPPCAQYREGFFLQQPFSFPPSLARPRDTIRHLSSALASVNGESELRQSPKSGQRIQMHRLASFAAQQLPHQDHGPPSKHKCALVQPTSQKSQREPGSLITHRLRITR